MVREAAQMRKWVTLAHTTLSFIDWTFHRRVLVPRFIYANSFDLVCYVAWSLVTDTNELSRSPSRIIIIWIASTIILCLNCSNMAFAFFFAGGGWHEIGSESYMVSIYDIRQWDVLIASPPCIPSGDSASWNTIGFHHKSQMRYQHRDKRLRSSGCIRQFYGGLHFILIPARNSDNLHFFHFRCILYGMYLPRQLQQFAVSVTFSHYTFLQPWIVAKRKDNILVEGFGVASCCTFTLCFFVAWEISGFLVMHQEAEREPGKVKLKKDGDDWKNQDFIASYKVSCDSPACNGLFQSISLICTRIQDCSWMFCIGIPTISCDYMRGWLVCQQVWSDGIFPNLIYQDGEPEELDSRGSFCLSISPPDPNKIKVCLVLKLISWMGC